MIDAASDEIGLRERKRTETRLRIERAAVAAVLRLGLDGATVDRIAADADVSSRTFFNYFASKEAAIVGMSSSWIQPDAVGARGTLTEDLVRIVVDVFGADSSHHLLHAERREVLHRHPEIGEAAFRAKNALVERLTEYAVDRLSDLSASERHQTASVVATTCLSAVRIAFHAAGPEIDSDHLHAAATRLVVGTAHVLA